VLDTKQQSPTIDSSSFHSLVGGSVQESCSTGLRKVLKKKFGKGYSGGGFSGSQSEIGEEVGKTSGAVNKMSKYM
jgi:hypothetical protein